MRRIPQKGYEPDIHGSFNEEWIAHKGCQDWWYCTGVLNDDDDNLHSYQGPVEK